MHDPAVPAANLDDVPPGKTFRIGPPDDGILLCNVAGRIYAVEDRCSHDGGELGQGELDGCRLECPRHGAYFDVTSGDALTLPAVTPIRTYAVRVESNKIYLSG